MLLRQDIGVAASMGFCTIATQTSLTALLQA